MSKIKSDFLKVSRPPFRFRVADGMNCPLILKLHSNALTAAVLLCVSLATAQIQEATAVPFLPAQRSNAPSEPLRTSWDGAYNKQSNSRNLASRPERTKKSPAAPERISRILHGGPLALLIHSRTSQNAPATVVQGPRACTALCF